MHIVDQLTARPFFGDGLGPGLAMLLVGVVVGLVWHRTGRSAAPVGGALLVAAALLSMPGAHQAPRDFPAGIAVLVLAGLVGAGLRLPLFGALLSVPGAWIVATNAALPHAGWIHFVVGAGTVVGGYLMGEFDSHHRAQAFGMPLLAVTVACVYFTVPDTEGAAVLLGAALPLALLGWPLPLASIGRAFAPAVTAVVLFTVARGGWARPSSVIGGAACLGLLVLVPAVRAVFRQRRDLVDVIAAGWSPTAAALPVCFVQLLFAGFASRIVGLRSTVAEALVLLGVGSVVAVAVAVGAPRIRPVEPHAVPLGRER